MSLLKMIAEFQAEVPGNGKCAFHVEGVMSVNVSVRWKIDGEIYAYQYATSMEDIALSNFNLDGDVLRKINMEYDGLVGNG